MHVTTPNTRPQAPSIPKGAPLAASGATSRATSPETQGPEIALRALSVRGSLARPEGFEPPTY
jgi:hypothetical protein